MFYTSYTLNAVKDVTDAAQIERIGQRACSAFSTAVARRECLEYISHPDVPQLLSVRAPADKICTATGLCSKIAA